MTTGILHDHNLEKHIEKQMGCMTGFFQLFDRHHILTGKRLYATKRLHAATSVNSTPAPESSLGSPAVSEKPHKTREMTSPSPELSIASPTVELRSPAEKRTKLPLPLPIYEFKEGAKSSWKFCKEAPRLSLDSRATMNAKGSSLYDGGDVEETRRSTSVVARLMGLEPLSNSSPEPTKKAELRRSASESRVSRDLFQSRFIEGNNFYPNQPNQSRLSNNVARNNVAVVENTVSTTASLKVRQADPIKTTTRNAKSAHKIHKSYFDSEDFFPEPKQAVSMYGEIEKRLKTRGIDEQSNDLETLKQILEALQLKGLLHSKKKPSSQTTSHRNLVYDRSFESPIVVMKPSRSPVSPVNGRLGSRVAGRRSLGNPCECSPAASPRRERPGNDRSVRNQVRERNSGSPSRREMNARSPNSPARKALNVETQRKGKLNAKRIGSDQTITTRSTRSGKSTAKIGIVTEDDDSCSISESSVTTPSQTDTERLKMEEYKGGRSLLERCNQLLHSIEEMNKAELLQPSPVSVLDSSFYKDESSSPSPIMKRGIDFKEHLGEFDEEIWSPGISSIEEKSDDCDFIYIAEILRFSNYLPEESDLFQLLEKQQYLKGNDTSKFSMLKRKLIFDTITEILDRKMQLPPWKVISSSNSTTAEPSLLHIWSEFKKIREREFRKIPSGDLLDVICGVLCEDLAGDAIEGWGDCPVEMSEVVLDIERLIFKDLVGEAIRDVGQSGGNSMGLAPYCRKLIF